MITGSCSAVATAPPFVQRLQHFLCMLDSMSMRAFPTPVLHFSCMNQKASAE